MILPSSSAFREEKVKNNIANFTRRCHHSSLKTTPLNKKLANLMSFNWVYSFSNGSKIVGQFDGELAKDGNTILNPTNIKAAYLNKKGEQIIFNWQDNDFVAFEITLDGSNILIVASDDHFVNNSMCLVSSSNRNRAQVTNNCKQIIGESFSNNRWLISPASTDINKEGWRVKLDVTPSFFFPFFTFNFNFSLSDPKTKYKCTFHPMFPFYPLVSVNK